MDNEDFIREQRERIMRRLKLTRRNETICLRDWEVDILVEWIDEMKGRDAMDEKRSRMEQRTT